MSIESKLVISGVTLLCRVLESGKTYTYAELVARMSGEMRAPNVAQSLLRLSKKGLVENVGRGLWKVL